MDGVICDVKQYLPFSDMSQTSRRGTNIGGNDLARGVQRGFRSIVIYIVYVKDHILSLTAETVVFFICVTLSEKSD